MAIWFTSDWHFNHDKEFIWKSRGFSSIQEHDEILIERYNSLVKDEDEVYVLGDLIMGQDRNYSLDCLKKMKGQLHIIVGNHDTTNRTDLYIEELYDRIMEINFAGLFKYKGYSFFLCHYPTITSNNDQNKPLKARIINLCGHTHTTDKWSDMDKGYIYHVEVDAHSCFPVHIDNIIEGLRLRKTG